MKSDKIGNYTLKWNGEEYISIKREKLYKIQWNYDSSDAIQLCQLMQDRKVTK